MSAYGQWGNGVGTDLMRNISPANSTYFNRSINMIVPWAKDWILFRSNSPMTPLKEFGADLLVGHPKLSDWTMSQLKAHTHTHHSWFTKQQLRPLNNNSCLIFKSSRKIAATGYVDLVKMSMWSLLVSFNVVNRSGNVICFNNQNEI